MASNASAPIMDITTDSDEDSSASADNLGGVFNVNRILFEQESDGKKIYLIEWENYLNEESTWEPEENIDSKQTLRDWEDERLRQREGLSTPFDLDDFYKRQKIFRKEEKEKKREKEREKERQKRRKLLGISAQSPPGAFESKSDQDVSSEEAEEDYDVVEDAPGISSSKKPRSRQLMRRNSAPDDDVFMGGSSDSSDSPLMNRAQKLKAKQQSWNKEGSEKTALDHSGRARPMAKILNRSEKPLTASGIHISKGLRNVSEPKPLLFQAPSKSGYHGTSNRGGSSGPTSSPGLRGRSSRGRPHMEGRSSLMKTSTTSRGQRSIQQKILKEAPMKDVNGPQLFKTKRLERKFELAARSLADRPPTQVPRLINPADYANQRARKKASTINIQPTASVFTDIPSLPSTTQPVPDMVMAQLGSNDDNMDYLFEEPEDMSNRQPIPAETEKEALQQRIEELHGANQATRRSIASQRNSTDAEFDRFSHVAAETSYLGPSPALMSPSSNFDKPPPTGPRRSLSETLSRTLVPHAEMRSQTMDHPPAQVRKVSLVDYAARQNGVQLKTFFGGSQVQDTLLTFVDIDAQDANWRSKIQQLENITFDNMCRSTDINNHTSELSPVLLARGRVITSKVDDKPAQEIIRTVADSLRVSISGLLFTHASFSIIIYPTRCEEWKFIEYGIQGNVDDQLAFFAFTSSSVVPSHSWNENSEDPVSTVNIDGVEDYDLLNEVVLGYKYQNLLLPAEKKSSPDVFFLVFPNMAAPLAEHMMTWLRHCNKNCKLFTCQQAGSWLQFIKATRNLPASGSLLIHESMISLIPRYPKLQLFLANGLNNVWCIDEGFPDGKMLSRLFPQGGAVCLTPSFLFSEPKAAFLFLHWFLKKRLPGSTMGTWKLVICHDFYRNVEDLAFNGEKRRKKLLENLPAGLSDSDKEAVAASKGLSLKQCNYRIQMVGLVDNLLHFKHESEIDRGSKFPDESNSPIVYADPEIDSADEQGLVNFFAFWSFMKLKSFRRFIVIGAKTTIPQEDQLRPQPEPRDFTPTEARSARLAPMAVASEITNPTLLTKEPPAQQMAPERDLSPAQAPHSREPSPNSLEETPIDLNVDPLILHFIVATGASAVEAKEFLRRGGDDLVRAVKLYKLAQNLSVQAHTMPADPSSHTGTASPSYPLPAFLPATYSSMPSDHLGLGESDVVMEDAPSDAPIESPAAHAHPSVEQPSDHPSDHPGEPQPSVTGIVTSENGTRFVPRSVRASGTVRHEISIRPGYVPPEEVYKVRREGADGEPMSRSGSESRSAGGTNRMSRESSAARSHGGVLTPVSPMEHGGCGMDGASEVQARPGEQGERSERKASILEWYAEKKRKGDGWNHVAVVGWEEAFKLLRVESK